MSLIEIRNLTFAYPGSFDNVFEGLNFRLDTSWRLGLVGRNGRGKTTLLGLLSGELRGWGLILSEREPARFPFACDLSRTAGEMLAARSGAEAWEIEREWSLLEAPEEALSRPLAELSPGERTKAMLAALFLEPERFLLLDEPTNHLDAAGRAALGRYLARKRGFVLVSHDRALLDACVDHVLALTGDGPQLQQGRYSDWKRNREYAEACERARHDKLRKDARRLTEAARRSAGWSEAVERSKIGAHVPDRGFVGHKAAKMMKRAKTIEARQQKAIEEKSALLKNAETAEDLRVTPLLHYADPLVLFQDVEIRYGGRTVCGPLTFAVRQGERVALDGGNGTGKSSLLKLLCGQDIPHAGQVRRAPGLVVSYAPQDAAGLAGDLTGFARAHGLDESLFKAILRKMDFSRIQFEKDMASFSSGQKKKVLLARSLCEKAHLYVWDEPLNFIDIYTRMQIEKLIGASAPSMLFVEHDAAFRQAVATGTVRL